MRSSLVLAFRPVPRAIRPRRGTRAASAFRAAAAATLLLAVLPARAEDPAPRGSEINRAPITGAIAPAPSLDAAGAAALAAARAGVEGSAPDRIFAEPSADTSAKSAGAGSDAPVGADASRASGTSGGASAAALGGGPGESRFPAGSSAFLSAYPDLLSGHEVTGSLIYEDFHLAVETTITGFRIWTLEDGDAWRGYMDYAIHVQSDGLPGVILHSAVVVPERAATGRSIDFGGRSYDEYVYEFSLAFPLRREPGTYWVSIHMHETCGTNLGVYWESGTPGYASEAIRDPGCDGSNGIYSGQLALEVFGTESRVMVGFDPPGPRHLDDPPGAFTNDLGGDDRGIAIVARTRVPVRSLGISAILGSDADLFAIVRERNGHAIGQTLASASIRAARGGPGFFDVPLDFVFEAGRSYDVAFNVAGGWGRPSAHSLEILAFDNHAFDAAAGFDEGPFLILDGRGPAPSGSSDPYDNVVMPRIRAGLDDASFDAYGLLVANDPPGDHLVGFNLDAPQNFTLIAPLPRDGEWSGADFRPGTGIVRLHAIDSRLNVLATFDTVTGEYAQLGAVTPAEGETFTALAFDPSSGTLYVAGSSGAQSSLYRMNPDTGATTRIGKIAGPDAPSTPKAIVGLASDQNGLLYGLDADGDRLVRVLGSTGAATAVGSLGVDVSFSQGMDYDPFTERIYGGLYTADQHGELREIDPATGAAAYVADLGTNSPGGGSHELSSMAIALDWTPAPTPSPTPTPGPARLENISTRGAVGAGDNVMIAGFIVQGSGTRRVLVTGIGPDLANFGVPGVLADPELALFSGQTVLATNNDWQESPDAALIGSSGYAPNDAREAAIVADLAPGAYTAKLSGRLNSVGNGLVQVFDLGGAEASLTNISTRGPVLSADGVMIAGITIEGTGSRTLLVRGLGPTLSQFGVAGALEDPLLAIFQGQTAIQANDNWPSQPDPQSIQDSGLAPPDPREPAIRITLPPGQYTAILQGAGGTEGVGLVEVYRLD